MHKLTKKRLREHMPGMGALTIEGILSRLHSRGLSLEEE